MENRDVLLTAADLEDMFALHPREIVAELVIVVVPHARPRVTRGFIEPLIEKACRHVQSAARTRDLGTRRVPLIGPETARVTPR